MSYSVSRAGMSLIDCAPLLAYAHDLLHRAQEERKSPSYLQRLVEILGVLSKISAYPQDALSFNHRISALNLLETSQTEFQSCSLSGSSIDKIKRALLSVSSDQKTALGIRYLHGDGVPKSRIQAQQLLQEPARSGDCEAQFWLAACCEERKTAPFTLAALQWYEEAAKKDCVPALYRLAYLYHQGLVTPVNEAKAMQFFSRAYILEPSLIGPFRSDLQFLQACSTYFNRMADYAQTVPEADNFVRAGDSLRRLLIARKYEEFSQKETLVLKALEEYKSSPRDERLENGLDHVAFIHHQYPSLTSGVLGREPTELRETLAADLVDYAVRCRSTMDGKKSGFVAHLLFACAFDLKQVMPHSFQADGPFLFGVGQIFHGYGAAEEKGKCQDDFFGKAFTLFKIAAEQGFAPARLRFGLYSYIGRGTSQNISEVVRQITLAYESDFLLSRQAVLHPANGFNPSLATVMIQEAQKFLTGIDFEQNKEVAVRIFACVYDFFPHHTTPHLEDADLLFSLAKQFQRLASAPSPAHVQQHFNEQAVSTFRKAADKGHHTALLELALSHQQGIGVMKSAKIADELYSQAREVNPVATQEFLARVSSS